MNKDSKIFVSGHRGLVGSAIVSRLRSDGFSNIITRSHSELNLTCQKETNDFFDAEKPEYVFHCAAKVGGIMANMAQPSDFYYENTMITMNVLHSSLICGVKKLLFIASTSVYPPNAPQPVSEDWIFSGEPEKSNGAYAISKLTGIKFCEFCNNQYNTKFIPVIPTNLFGMNDRFDPESAHVIPALIRKFAVSMRDGTNAIEIWGTGNARREFMHSADLCDACLFIMENYTGSTPLNVGVGADIAIRDLADIIKKISGFNGEIVWNDSKPDGVLRRQTDCSKLFALGWKPVIAFEDALAGLYHHFIEEILPYEA